LLAFFYITMSYASIEPSTLDSDAALYCNIVGVNLWRALQWHYSLSLLFFFQNNCCCKYIFK